MFNGGGRLAWLSFCKVMRASKNVNVLSGGATLFMT